MMPPSRLSQLFRRLGFLRGQPSVPGTDSAVVIRGQGRVPEEAFKRSSITIHSDGFGGQYGEAPPPTATATPWHYIQSEAVHAAVNSFANRIVSTPLCLYRQREDGTREELKQHPALDVLANPNPFLTRSELMWHVVADYLLSGNAWWFLAGPEGRAPTEIWRCDARATRVVRSRERYIAGYVTDIEGQTIPLHIGEVIPFRAPNPFDEFYGLGRLAAAALAAQTGRDMSEWNRGTFSKNNAVPAGVVIIEDNVPDADFERLKREWRESYGGKERKTAFLRGSKVQFQAMGLSQTDVDFLNGAKWEAEKVYRVFGTYHLLPAEHAGDSKLYERQFLEEQAWPLLVYLAEVLTDQFLTFWGPAKGPGKLIAEFEDIRPRERALDLEEARERSKGLFFNEWRQEQGLPPKPGWDDVLFVQVQSGRTPLSPEPPTLSQLLTPPVSPPSAPPPPPPTPLPAPAATQGADEKAGLRESAGNDIGDDIGDYADKAVIHKELATWMRFQQRRIKADDGRSFRPDVTPHWLADLLRETLPTCADEAQVKATFEMAHELLEGHLAPPIKSSYGTASGTVVLYLSGVEDILRHQQAQQLAYPADAPIRWTPQAQMHITVVHAPLVDEPAFRDAFQEVAGSFAGLDLQGATLTTFPAHGSEPVPLALLMQSTPDLRRFQMEVYTAFQTRGVALSEYSTPERWTPHITLGYIEASYAPAIQLPTDLPVDDIYCRANLVAFTRGDYLIINARGEAETAPTSYPAGKAIQATRLDFEGEFETLLEAARQSDIDRRTFSARLRTLLRKYGELAYRDGLMDGGLEDGELDDEERAELNMKLAAQSEYVTDLGGRIYKDEMPLSDAIAEQKPALWWNKSLNPIYQAGRLSADKNGLYEFLLGRTEEHCETCLRLNGQIHRMKDWARRNLIPPGDSPTFACGGWQCDCKLQRKDKGRARGAY